MLSGGLVGSGPIDDVEDREDAEDEERAEGPEPSQAGTATKTQAMNGERGTIIPSSQA